MHLPHCKTHFFIALGLLTRLPIPGSIQFSPEGLARSVPYLPVVGVLLGGVSALAFMLASAFWPKTLAVLLAIGLVVYLTGAFHEDGLADTVDGLGGGWETARVLEIMKDSRVGSFGVVALILVLLGRFVTLVEMPQYLVPAALVAGHGLSRGAVVLVMQWLDYVRDGGDAKSSAFSTRLGWGGMLLAGAAVLLSLLWVLAVAPGRTLLGLLLAGLTLWWLVSLFQRRLGGYTGDCLGALQQGVELAFYAGLLLAFQGRA